MISARLVRQFLTEGHDLSIVPDKRYKEGFDMAAARDAGISMSVHMMAFNLYTYFLSRNPGDFSLVRLTPVMAEGGCGDVAIGFRVEQRPGKKAAIRKDPALQDAYTVAAECWIEKMEAFHDALSDHVAPGTDVNIERTENGAYLWIDADSRSGLFALYRGLAESGALFSSDEFATPGGTMTHESLREMFDGHADEQLGDRLSLNRNGKAYRNWEKKIARHWPRLIGFGTEEGSSFPFFVAEKANVYFGLTDIAHMLRAEGVRIPDMPGTHILPGVH